MSRHVCDDWCMCPIHSSPLIYAPGRDEHACQDVECKYGSGVEINLHMLTVHGRFSDQLVHLDRVVKHYERGGYLVVVRFPEPESNFFGLDMWELR